MRSPPDCPSQLLRMCPHKLNVALRLLTPVAGSLTATQPRGTTFHRSRPPTSAYVFLIRFVLFFSFYSFNGHLRGVATTPAAVARGPPPLPTQEGRSQPRPRARKPPCRHLLPLAATPASAIPCNTICGHAVWICFFFLFFRFFLTSIAESFSSLSPTCQFLKL